VFSNYGPELPNFDDVNDIIENAEDELQSESNPRAAIKKTRGWNLGTARLSISNPNQYDGLDHRSLSQFLTALKESGWLYGFFGVHITFYDDWFTIPEKGTAFLERESSALISKVDEIGAKVRLYSIERGKNRPYV